MKSLSITKRLTLTFAVMTAAVVVPASVALYVSVARAYTAESIEKVTDRANSVARSILGQLDEEIFIEFEGQPVQFPQLRADAEDWAIVRGDGTIVEHLSGVFSDTIRAEERSPLEPIAVNGRTFRVTAIPLVHTDHIPVEDLPPLIRSAAAEYYPDAKYLTAVRAISKGQNIVEVLKLIGNRVAEIKLFESGDLRNIGSDRLPDEFDRAFLRFVPLHRRPVADLELTWTSHAGQLIAIVSGTTSEGRPETFAMNRLGELFELNANGEVEGIESDSQLFVLAAVDIEGELARKRTLLIGLALGGPLVWLGLVMIGWFVARRAMSPVGGIVEATRRIHLSDLADRVPVGNADDELSRIATTINEMLDRLETGYRRERQFTGDASHELRGPLTKIQADAELALSRPRGSEEYRSALRRIDGYSLHMKRLVESLLLLARLDGNQERLKKDRFDLTELIVETVATFADDDAARIHLSFDGEDPPIVAEGQRSLIGTALHNLVDNALRYSPPAEPVEVRIRRAGSRVVIEVEDRGPGLSREDAARVFDRFFRVDAARTPQAGAPKAGGCGLGLSIVRAIAGAHGTHVDLRAATPSGTIARFELAAKPGGVRVPG